VFAEEIAMQKFIAIVLVIAALSTACFGQITYLSQDRWISATNGAGGSPETRSATGFEPFIEKVSLNYGGSSQTSTLEPGMIKAKGVGSGQKFNGWCGSGKSHFAVSFEVFEPTSWSLSGVLQLSGWNDSASLALTGTGVNIVHSIKLPQSFLSLNESGVLEPGAYVISADCHGGCGGSGPGGVSTFNFEWSLGAPCAPDCDANAQLSIDDFICFMTAYSLGEASADCDGDGSLTIDDFICFQTAFALGC
jgi:hypothetical protein